MSVPNNLSRPESTEFGSIFMWMAHSPTWEAALLDARAQIGDRDPYEIRNRVCRVRNETNTYNKATRDLIADLYEGDDLDALIAAVVEAETSADMSPESTEIDGSLGELDRPLLNRIEPLIETITQIGDTALNGPVREQALLDLLTVMEENNEYEKSIALIRLRLTVDKTVTRKVAKG